VSELENAKEDDRKGQYKFNRGKGVEIYRLVCQIMINGKLYILLGFKVTNLIVEKSEGCRCYVPA
jgi:hypothetical protein